MAQRADGAGDPRGIAAASGWRGLAGLLVRTPWLWWLGVAIWAWLLWFLSGRTSLPQGPQLPHLDKLQHFLYFAGGGFCFALALCGRRALPARQWWLAGLLFAALVGALDEYHQTFTPGRSGNDPWDWLDRRRPPGSAAPSRTPFPDSDSAAHTRRCRAASTARSFQHLIAHLRDRPGAEAGKHKRDQHRKPHLMP
jgi:hypothetical protein